MTEPASLLDPFDLLRGLASRLEKGLEQAADRGVRSTRLTRAMHTGLSATLLARNLSGKLQARLFEALNLPARSDVLKLGERLQALEDRIIALSVQLERRGGGAPSGRGLLPRASPPRTRKPAAIPAKAAAAFVAPITPIASIAVRGAPAHRRKAPRA